MKVQVGIILSTSDIFRTFPSKENGELMYEGVRSNGEPFQVWSTGKLEKALASGLRVMVASTRSSLGDHDEWWVSLVGRENIFLADSMEHAHCSTGWKNLFAHLGWDWPTNESGQDVFWTEVAQSVIFREA